MDIVGIGGTLRADSSSERALTHALRRAAELGARTTCFGAADLDLPMYDPAHREPDPRGARLVAALAAADGVIVSTPGYHGGVSGLVKNALDHVEALRDDPRPYLDGRAVGCIVCAHGCQAGGTTLTSLRSVVHALRGWPTPLGVVINSAVPDPHVTGGQLDLLAHQVVDFARSRAGVRA